MATNNTKRVARIETKPVAETKVAPKGKTRGKATPAKVAKVERVTLTASGKPISLEKVTLNPSAKIKVLAENPYRDGSKKAAAFAVLAKCKTVAEALEKVASDRITWAARRELIKVG